MASVAIHVCICVCTDLFGTRVIYLEGHEVDVYSTMYTCNQGSLDCLYLLVLFISFESYPLLTCRPSLIEFCGERITALKGCLR